MDATIDQLELIDAYWRAANYLSVGQIYLLDNPLLSEPLAPEHVKPRLLGHWGTTPGLNFIYAHLNRADPAARPERDLRHRARARRPGPGRQRLPGGHLQRGLPAHRPRRARASGACFASSRSRAGSPAMSRPRRRARSTRAASSATRWSTRTARRSTTRTCWSLLRHRRRRGRDRPAGGELALEQVPQPRPRRRGAADPAPQRLQDRQPDRAGADPRDELRALLEGYGYAPRFVEGSDPATMHQLMAATLDEVARRDRRDPASRAGTATASAGRGGR